MLSLVVITRDEADRLAGCLASVPVAAERLVLDSGSTDGTPAVAEAAGARVIVTDWPGHVVQKNRALATATQPWVLSLDADERLSPEAAASLQRALQDPGDAVGFSFPRRNVWLGTPLTGGRWYPDRKLRVVRAGRGRWEGDDPHDHLVADGPVRALTGDIVHVPYRDLSEHLRTIDRYTAIHAAALHARGVRARRRDVMVRPAWHFVRGFVLERGFVDGPAGFAVAWLGATHTLCKWWRLRELGA